MTNPCLQKEWPCTFHSFSDWQDSTLVITCDFLPQNLFIIPYKFIKNNSWCVFRMPLSSYKKFMKRQFNPPPPKKEGFFCVLQLSCLQIVPAGSPGSVFVCFTCDVTGCMVCALEHPARWTCVHYKSLLL